MNDSSKDSRRRIGGALVTSNAQDATRFPTWEAAVAWRDKYGQGWPAYRIANVGGGFIVDLSPGSPRPAFAVEEPTP